MPYGTYLTDTIKNAQLSRTCARSAVTKYLVRNTVDPERPYPETQRKIAENPQAFSVTLSQTFEAILALGIMKVGSHIIPSEATKVASAIVVMVPLWYHP